MPSRVKHHDCAFERRRRGGGGSYYFFDVVRCIREVDSRKGGGRTLLTPLPVSPTKTLLRLLC